MPKPKFATVAVIGLLLLSFLLPWLTPLPSIPRAHGANRSITLVGYALSGWNGTSPTPNPPVTVTQGDIITLSLSSGDGIPHRFVVDVDNDGKIFYPICPPDKCSAVIPPSTPYQFPVDFPATTYTYYCTYHPTAMFGNFVVQGFTVASSSAPLTINQGSSGMSTISLTSINNFAGTVSLSASSSPSGLTLSQSPPSVMLTAGGSASSILTVSTTGTPPGVYTVTVTGTSGSATNTATLTVYVPDFSIATSPALLNIAPSASGTSTITLTSLYGFAGTVSLLASVSPTVTNGPTATLSPTSVTLTSGGSGISTLTISTVNTTPPGTYSVTVTGSSGSLSHSVTVAVVGAEFSIVSNPPSLGIAQGNSGTSNITIASLNGFSGTVSLAVSVSPTGPGVSVSPATITLTPGGTGTVILRVSTTAGAYSTAPTPGNYTISITATSGTLSHSMTVPLAISSPSSAAGSIPPSVLIGGVVVAVIALIVLAIFIARRKKVKK